MTEQAVASGKEGEGRTDAGGITAQKEVAEEVAIGAVLGGCV
jgi:hypothetical protein